MWLYFPTCHSYLRLPSLLALPRRILLSAPLSLVCILCSSSLVSGFPLSLLGGKFAMKHVPANLRRILAAESAANDGLAYPFLSIAIYLTTESSRGVAFKKWFLVGWLCMRILIIVRTLSDNCLQTKLSSERCWVPSWVSCHYHGCGTHTHFIYIGRLFCIVMKISYKRGFIDRESYVAQYLALALLTIGVASTIGTDDLLAAFAAGMLCSSFTIDSR